MSKSKKDQPLDEREQAFVREYVADPDRNATAAAMRAGFSPHNQKSAKVTASKLRKDERIRAAIAELEAAASMAIPELTPLPPKVPAAEGSRRSPVKYSDELVDRALELLERGYTLKEICESEGMMDKATFLAWAGDGPRSKPGLAERYDRAVVLGIDYRLDDCRAAFDAATRNEKVTQAHLTAIRARAEFEWKLAQTRLRGKYGTTKVEVEDVTPRQPDRRTPEEIAERLRQLSAETGVTLPADIDLPKPTVEGVRTRQ